MESEILLSIAGLTYAIVEAVKRTRIPTRYAGFVAMFVGVNVTMLYAVRDDLNLADPSVMANATLIGLIAGLTASGFYSTSKAATEEPPKKEIHYEIDAA